MLRNIRNSSEFLPECSPLLRKWGESIDTLSPSLLEAFKSALIKVVQGSKAKGYVRRKCTGWEVASDTFPSHKKAQNSPTSRVEGVIKEENRKFLDIFKFSLNSVIGVKSLQTSEELENANCSRKRQPNRHMPTSDDLAICIFRFVDRLTEYFQFVSISSLVVTLVYLERYLKSAAHLYFTGMKWIKR